jgi:hypothetical protein
MAIFQQAAAQLAIVVAYHRLLMAAIAVVGLVTLHFIGVTILRRFLSCSI